MHVEQRAAERPFGSRIARDFVLIRRQLLVPLFVCLHHLRLGNLTEFFARVGELHDLHGLRRVPSVIGFACTGSFVQ